MDYRAGSDIRVGSHPFQWVRLRTDLCRKWHLLFNITISYSVLLYASAYVMLLDTVSLIFIDHIEPRKVRNCK